MQPDLGLTTTAGMTLWAQTAAVFKASALLRDESERLRSVVARVQGEGFRRCAEDPISVAVADAYNAKSRELIRTYTNHVQELDQQANELESSAHAYDTSDRAASEAF
ncbi:MULTISPECIES: PE domain-containing protein [Pseudonocardia]|uniref:PE domain-containing protein n=1 Tax=Pseudonocardia TaxID=1847 RepID=UPI00117C73E3|nr:PE domain-containing protein [Pseudonocardia dioxanivorans]GJF03510.1 hypothetical protein PSD17_24700 [Pseudonocardia sp. D17]